MSGFPDEAFSLDALGDAPPAETLEPGYLADLDYVLRFQSWRERLRSF
jgi:hypothetical protein